MPAPLVFRVVMILILTAAIPAAAQDLLPSKAAPETAPISLVTLEFSASGAGISRASVPVGGFASYRDRARGYALGVIVRRMDKITGEIELSFFDLHDGQHPHTVAAGQEIDRAVGALGFESFVALDAGVVDVRIVELRLLDSEESTTVGSSDGIGRIKGGLLSRDPCCVTCGSTTTCGCGVGTGCGSCCGCGLPEDC